MTAPEPCVVEEEQPQVCESCFGTDWSWNPFQQAFTCQGCGFNPDRLVAR